MSWKNPHRNNPTKREKYTIAGAVDYFKNEELEPLIVDGSCPYCRDGYLQIEPVDVEERIELRIGAFRIACCLNCEAYCVVKSMRKKKMPEVEVKSNTTDEEYRTLLRVPNKTGQGCRLCHRYRRGRDAHGRESTRLTRHSASPFAVI